MSNFWVKIGLLAAIVLALVVAVKFLSSPSSQDQIQKVDFVPKQNVKPVKPLPVIKPQKEPNESNQPPELEPEAIEKNTDTNAPVPQPQAKVDEPVQPLDEAANMEASRLLETVKFEYDTGKKLLTFKKMVDTCREIFQRYPNSQQARDAREYLRKMPARFRNNYKVTNEELGFTEQQAQTQ